MADNVYIMGDEDRRRFAKIVASAWSDESFARRYTSAPYAVLAEYGIEYPSHVQPPPVPAKPDGEMTLETLELVAGDAAGMACASSVSCIMPPGPATQPCYCF
jgi:putative thiazole/oxazole-modified microcin (TOMM)-like peptide